jgi:hypothetical protein
MTKVELYAIGTSTTLASNKSLRRNQREWAIFKAGSNSRCSHKSPMRPDHQCMAAAHWPPIPGFRDTFLRASHAEPCLHAATRRDEGATGPSR